MRKISVIQKINLELEHKKLIKENLLRWIDEGSRKGVLGGRIGGLKRRARLGFRIDIIKEVIDEVKISPTFATIKKIDMMISSDHSSMTKYKKNGFKFKSERTAGSKIYESNIAKISDKLFNTAKKKYIDFDTQLNEIYNYVLEVSNSVNDLKNEKGMIDNQEIKRAVMEEYPELLL